jgi:hypothetical protein
VAEVWGVRNHLNLDDLEHTSDQEIDAFLTSSRPGRELQQRGATKAQPMEAIMHAQLTAGARGLEQCYRLSS